MARAGGSERASCATYSFEIAVPLCQIASSSLILASEPSGPSKTSQMRQTMTASTTLASSAAQQWMQPANTGCDGRDRTRRGRSLISLDNLSNFLSKESFV
jgi:hypothetical protein